MHRHTQHVNICAATGESEEAGECLSGLAKCHSNHLKVKDTQSQRRVKVHFSCLTEPMETPGREMDTIDTPVPSR